MWLAGGWGRETLFLWFINEFTNNSCAPQKNLEHNPKTSVSDKPTNRKNKFSFALPPTLWGPIHLFQMQSIFIHANKFNEFKIFIEMQQWIQGKSDIQKSDAFRASSSSLQHQSTATAALYALFFLKFFLFSFKPNQKKIKCNAATTTKAAAAIDVTLNSTPLVIAREGSNAASRMGKKWKIIVQENFNCLQIDIAPQCLAGACVCECVREGRFVLSAPTLL